jgi:Protein of unknown function (DUF2889)
MTVDPRHGTHDPTTSNPSRRPDSIRRTTSIDMLRPNGLGGAVRLVGSGRDLFSKSNGDTKVRNVAGLNALVDFHHGRKIEAIHLDPEDPRTQDLVGISAGSGFRSAVDKFLPELHSTGDLVYQLLDDIPVATLVSGFALQQNHYPQKTITVPQQQADICSGWRSDGTIMVELRSTGRVPPPTGPLAPSLESIDDPLAWHEMSTLPAQGMRRQRRLDLWTDHTGALQLDSMFRDTYMDADGATTVVHEYAVSATLDPKSFTIRSIAAQPHVLPWMECPAAAASAARLEDQGVGNLRSRVRDTFLGVGTCTHLNDQLRTLADVPTLAAALTASP